MIGTGWFAEVEVAVEETARTLISLGSFSATIEHLVTGPESPLDGLGYELTIPGAGSYSIGKRGDNGPSDFATLSTLDHVGTQGRVLLWRKRLSEGGLLPVDSGRLLELLTRLFATYWRRELRDEKSGLLSLQFPDAYQLADNTILRALEEHKSVCVFFADLDHLRVVNNTYGQAAGDRAIRAFAVTLDSAVRGAGIPIHRSGDEFTVLLPGTTCETALSMARNAMAALASDSTIPGGPLHASIGIAFLEATDAPISYRELEELAEKAIKPGGGIKHRRVARFSGQNRSAITPKAAERDYARSLCLVKTLAFEDRPFASPWLNVISAEAARHCVDLSKVSVAVDALVAWMRPDIRPENLHSALASDGDLDLLPGFSAADVAFAVAHGVLHAAASGVAIRDDAELTLYTTDDATAVSLVLAPDEIELFSMTKSRGNPYRLGRLVTGTRPRLGDSCARAVLVKIGHWDLSIPEVLFADVITVDDRPTRGGGLPDFWEATVGRLVNSVERNPNIVAVYVLGNEHYAVRSVACLRSVNTWKSDVAQLSYKTGAPAESIRAVSERLAEAVFFPTSEPELLMHLSQVLRPRIWIGPSHDGEALPARFLRRTLNLDSMSLGPKDGCRVRTIAEAFPIVLEIARQSTDETPIRDQAGQPLRELIDFKVEFLSPEVDMIPSFYVSDKELLDQYFVDQFVKSEPEETVMNADSAAPKGLFGVPLAATGQLDAVLDHLAAVAKDWRRQFATRRAILVVPHEINPSRELSPLGLVSVRAIPRFHDRTIRINYSFTWRTVEVLVGFPYSAYGSVRYGQHLTAAVRSRLPVDIARRVEMGTVSYVAHSLHMFLDYFRQGIARRIVDDASV